MKNLTKHFATHIDRVIFGVQNASKSKLVKSSSIFGVKIDLTMNIGSSSVPGREFGNFGPAMILIWKFRTKQFWNIFGVFKKW